jgi:hypothetical protein
VRNTIIKGVAFVLFFVLAGFSLSSAQEITDARYEFKPFITLQEKYTTNANNVATNKKHDYITTITPGIAFAGNDAVFGVDLGAGLNYNIYANKSIDDYAGYDGHINLRYNPDPTLTFRLRDNAVRSENPRRPDFADTSTTPSYLASIDQGRLIYTMNRLEPSVDWQFTRDGNLGFSYVNDIYRSDNNTANESTTHTFTPRFSYSFNQQNGVLFDYSYTKGDNTVSPDLQGHAYHGRYTYKFDPRSSVFADYSFIKRDYDAPGTSYDIHSPTVGIEYAFSATLTGLLQLGYYYSNPSQGDSNSGLNGTGRLTWKDQFTTYSIELKSGYNEALSGVQGANENFAREYGVKVMISHMLTERFSIGMTASAQELDYVYANRKDRNYAADLNASYQVLKWLSLFGRVGYWWNDSPLYPTDRFDEFHAIIGLTATYL